VQAASSQLPCAAGRPLVLLVLLVLLSVPHFHGPVCCASPAALQRLGLGLGLGQLLFVRQPQQG
jgi:hypothetical protein